MDSQVYTEKQIHDFDLYSYFYGLVRQIPKGKITTYGALARALGDVVASRACGHMLSINPHPDVTPCYRVVKSDGSVWKFTHALGVAEKERRLNADGIRINDGKIEDFENVLFDNFDSCYPLEKMKEWQNRARDKLVINDDYTSIKMGAVDVSYDDHFGYGSFVFEENGNLKVKNAVMPVHFPYIPGYLAFREFKFIRELCKGFEGILLVDANGYLHPRRIGLASYAGVMMDIPTIGVAKSLLLGKRNGRWIDVDGEKVAYAVNEKTIVSAGHRVSLETSLSILRERYGERYPDLLKQAHNATVKLRTENAPIYLEELAGKSGSPENSVQLE